MPRTFYWEEATGKFHTWMNNAGEDLVIHALEIAVQREKRQWGYVEGILRSWKKKAIQTVDDAEKESVPKASSKKYFYAPNGQNSQEILPYWWENHQEESRRRSEEERKKREERDPDEVREEIEKFKREIQAQNNTKLIG